MTYIVYLIEDAERDLRDIYNYVSLNDSPDHANTVLERIETAILKLETMPHRGHIPPELERIAILEFREVFYKPYRIIYQTIDKSVFVHCIIDGRRDMQDILQQRLLR